MSRPFNTPNVFRAIADPTRRKMLDLLLQKDRTPGDLLQHFQISHSAISQHLRSLRLAGLIEERRFGKGVIYAVTAGPLQSVLHWAQPFAHAAQSASRTRRVASR